MKFMWLCNGKVMSYLYLESHLKIGMIKQRHSKITRLVSYYELKDATATFELALWKSKLNQADASNTTNRAAYRIDVPGPVKDTILQYLDHNI